MYRVADVFMYSPAWQVGGWKGTADTHNLIEQTHKNFLTAERNIRKRSEGIA